MPYTDQLTVGYERQLAGNLSLSDDYVHSFSRDQLMSRDRSRIEVFGEVFNLTNRVNFANPAGNQANANFLLVTGYSTSTTPRTAQFGARLVFSSP